LGKKSQNHLRKNGKRLDKYAKKKNTAFGRINTIDVKTLNNRFLIIYFKKRTDMDRNNEKQHRAVYTHYIIKHNNMARAIFADVVVRKTTNYGNKKRNDKPPTVHYYNNNNNIVYGCMRL